MPVPTYPAPTADFAAAYPVPNDVPAARRSDDTPATTTLAADAAGTVPPQDEPPRD